MYGPNRITQQEFPGSSQLMNPIIWSLKCVGSTSCRLVQHMYNRAIEWPSNLAHDAPEVIRHTDDRLRFKKYFSKVRWRAIPSSHCPCPTIVRIRWNSRFSHVRQVMHISNLQRWAKSTNFPCHGGARRNAFCKTRSSPRSATTPLS